MKKVLVGFLILLLAILLSSTSYYLGYKQIGFPVKPSPSPVPVKKSAFCVPQDIPENQQLIEAKRLTIKDNLEKFMVFGFLANNPPEVKDNPSFIGIYKETPNGCELVYKFSPVLPEEQTTFPLLFENLWVENSLIISSWGQIGASYFGAYPVVITYKEGNFTLIPFYEENIAARPQLKNITWTQQDLMIKNNFNQNEEVKTILTQGISIQNNNISLRFYADNNCHACEHEYLFLSFPLP